MKIDFPDHPVGDLQRTPRLLFWKPRFRRRHWRWTVDHEGCKCSYYWRYLHYPAFRGEAPIPAVSNGERASG